MMRTCAIQVSKLLLVAMLGGMLAALLARSAPGFGMDDEELDSRLSHASLQALRQARARDGGFAGSYLHWLRDAAHGDLGFSIVLQQPVRTLLADRLPKTLKSVTLGLLLGWSLGLAMATAPLLLRSSVLDALGSVLAGLLLCLPAAVLALLSVLAHAPGSVVIGLIVMPSIFRYARNLLQHSAAQPHVITAWAKGVGTFRILLRHMLPPIAPQLLALGGISISMAFAAAIPVEALCDLPGLGQLAWKAAMGRDMALLVDLTMLVTLMTMLANSIAELAGGGLRKGALA